MPSLTKSYLGDEYKMSPYRYAEAMKAFQNQLNAVAADIESSMKKPVVIYEDW